MDAKEERLHSQSALPACDAIQMDSHVEAVLPELPYFLDNGACL